MLQSVRAVVAARLDALDGIEPRLELALASIHELESASDAAGQLTRLIYVIAALAHHARFGGLSDRDAAHLLKLAEALLISNQVERSTSTLSILWGELHVAQSQILRLAGMTYESMWEHHIGHQSSRRAPVGPPAFHSLAAGLRALRLGMLDLAVAALSSATSSDLPRRNVEQAHLALIQALRLSGQVDEAAAKLAELQKAGGLSAVASRDAAWEGHIIAATSSGDLAPMMHAVAAKAEARAPSLMLEAWLWARAVEKRGFENQAPSLGVVRKRLGPLAQTAASLRTCFNACRSLDEAYDADRPLVLRTRGVGDALARAQMLPSLDKELLLRAATFRWLLRAKQLELAGFVFADYTAKCRQLSRGANDDLLSCMSDIDRDRVVSAIVAPALRMPA
jgi:hypothetical protein